MECKIRQLICSDKTRQQYGLYFLFLSIENEEPNLRFCILDVAFRTSEYLYGSAINRCEPYKNRLGQMSLIQPKKVIFFLAIWKNQINQLVNTE